MSSFDVTRSLAHLADVDNNLSMEDIYTHMEGVCVFSRYVDGCGPTRYLNPDAPFFITCYRVLADFCCRVFIRTFLSGSSTQNGVLTTLLPLSNPLFYYE